MFFDTPQWPVVAEKDGAARVYAGVIQNSCTVSMLGGEQYAVAVEVPSGLFHFVRTTLKEDRIVLGDAQIYLDQDTTFGYVFGIHLRGVDHDLWSYRKLPDWAAR